MNPLERLVSESDQIEEKLGYRFKDKNLLALSFVHRSFVNENQEVTSEHNERLEFLGDSVIGVLVSEYLYRALPDSPEGQLSYLRAQLVDASACYRYVTKLEVEDWMLLGKGETRNAGRGRETILADLFEGLIGAIYLDGGLEPCRAFLFDNFEEEILDIMNEPVRNWKAELQDYSQKRYQAQPSYQIIEESGPDHSKIFKISVSVGGTLLGTGEGSSKKEAQQAAAEDALLSVEKEEEENESRW